LIAIILAVLAGVAIAVRATLRALRPGEVAQSVGNGHPGTSLPWSDSPIEPLTGSYIESESEPLPEPVRDPEPGGLAVPVVAHARLAAAEQADDADRWETCQIVWWRGYVRSAFAAAGFEADGSSEAIATSPAFKWRRAEQPPQDEMTIAAHRQLVDKLHALGWKLVEPGEAWYAGRYRRARVPEPQPVVPQPDANGAAMHARVVSRS
jgi:hypothetical protein